MEFELFSMQHFIYLFGYFVVFAILYLGLKNSRYPQKNMRAISIAILFIKLGEIFIRGQLIGEAWYTLLPLHLCNIVLIFSVLGGIFRFTPFLHASFYWSLGALFAVITPEVKDTFPSFFNISFFATHFFIMFASIVEYKIFKLRPTLTSWFASLFVINMIAVGVFFVNNSLGTNYLYINYKPTFNSPLDYMGEWPYYILVVEGIYIILTYLLYRIFKSKKNTWR